MRTSHTYIPFLVWLTERCDTAHDPLINEVSAEFPKEQINKLFNHEFEKAYIRVLGDDMHGREADGGLTVSLRRPIQHLSTFTAFHDYDWCGYISKALANAGIPHHDRDSVASKIVVQLLVKPGRLFTGWDGHAPLEARWKLSVKNAVINAATEAQRARKRKTLSFSEPGVVAAARGQEAGVEELVVGFASAVRHNLGEQASKLLHHLLAGGEVKDFVKTKELTSYRAKNLIKGLKQELAAFAARDPAFARQVARLLDQERQTLEKRFGDRRAAP
jgi:hypothetical protein